MSARRGWSWCGCGAKSGEVAGNHGYGIIAASTHPFAKWEEQEANPGERLTT